ncbi:MAG: hypothetical protein M5U23_00405 [Acidimicrobiia bacterium]|nr:hypothetical protein [Acidimicrobiia bacterium]
MTDDRVPSTDDRSQASDVWSPKSVIRNPADTYDSAMHLSIEYCAS